MSAQAENRVGFSLPPSAHGTQTNRVCDIPLENQNQRMSNAGCLGEI